MIDEHNCEQHKRYLRIVARALTPCSATAEDLVQDTLLYALRRSPARVRAPKAWLGRVLRSIAMNRAISEGRRRYRETRVAEQDTQEVDADHEWVAERVRRAVERLPHSHRTVVEAYYLDGVSLHLLAQRTGLSEAALRSRLKRARERLRRDLGSELEEVRSSWSLAAALSALWPLKPRFVAGGVALCVAAVWMASPRVAVSAPDETSARGVGPLDALVIASPEAGAASLVSFPAPTRRSARSVTEATEDVSTRAAPAPASDPRSRTVSFQVVDTQARPIPGVTVRAVRAQGADAADIAVALASCVSDGVLSGDDGTGLLREARVGDLLVVEDPEWTTFATGVVPAEDPRRVAVIAGRPIRTHGTVVDHAGQALRDAHVLTSVSPERLARLAAELDLELDDLVGVSQRVTSGPDGAFSLTDLRDRGALGFVVARPGQRRVRLQELPPGARIALEPLEGSNLLRARVVDSQGHAVPRARVSAGWLEMADLAGSFALRMRSGGRHGSFLRAIFGDRERHLFAVAPGRLPARVLVDPTATHRAPRTLRIGGPARSVSGRVVDPSGEPLAGVEVWITDPTFFDCREGFWSLEQAMRDQPAWAAIRTSADGTFELPGLRERPYRLAVRDPVSGASQLVPIGADAVAPLWIDLDEGPERREIRGTVVDPTGQPRAGIRVRGLRNLQEIRAESGELVFLRRVATTETLTDTSGRFALEVADEDGLDFRQVGSTPTVLSLDESPLGLDANLRVTVPRSVRIQLSPGLAAEVDSFELLDPMGSPLQGVRSCLDSLARPPLLRLAPGRTAAFSEEAAELVLHFKDRTVERRPLAIAAGELHIARR